MAVADKDILLGVLGRYTVMKRQIAAQEKTGKSKQKGKDPHER
jgi:hypothetical protein